MEDGNDQTSSSWSFPSSSCVSIGSPSCSVNMNSTKPESEINLENLSLRRLSSSLEKLLLEPGYDYSDADVEVEGVPVGVHRCLLAARSSFFHKLFEKEKGSDGNSKFIEGNGRRRYLISELVPNGCVRYEAFQAFLHYVYTGRLKPSPAEVSTCVDENCAHDACHPAINYAVELMYASATFQIKELVMLLQRRLSSLVHKALVGDLVPIIKVSFDCKLSQLRDLCIERISKLNIDEIVLEKELPHKISAEVKALCGYTPPKDQTLVTDPNHLQEKRIKQIHRALDSDDVALVKLLLAESDVTLDGANALHYASAYCEPKVFKDMLGLGKADVNLKDSRGYTVLHIAARRKSPTILMALLDKGASVMECTPDGQTAVVICKRSTRRKDYDQEMVQGQESNNDKMCIGVLEEEMRWISTSGNKRISFNPSHEELHMRLDYLESRVRFAALLFPAEARVAMENADADWTPLYRGLASRGSTRYFGPLESNEDHPLDAKRLREKLLALCKTVETGRRYFPHCSAVLDEFLDDMPDTQLPMGPEEELKFTSYYMDLKGEIQKAYNKDMAQNTRSGLSSSSACLVSPKDRVIKKVKTM